VNEEARALAIEAYNKGQDLYYSERSADQDVEMLSLAFLSRHYWRIAGGNQQFAIADWFVSRVFASMGEANLTVKFAQASLEYPQTNFPHWTKASLHEGAARAYKCAGDSKKCSEHIALANEVLESESNSADAQVIREQLAEL
jgi:hypothetical protein